MDKTAKFIISINPIVDDGRIFITHLREPVIIAEAFHFDLDEEGEYMKCKSQFSVGASVDYPDELITIGAIYVAPIKWEGQEAADKLAKIMSRMGDWYYSYLKWEDSQ